MEIMILHVHMPVPAAILHLQGELNGTSDRVLIEEIKRQSEEGFHNIVLDLTYVDRLNEAGLSTLKTAVSIFKRPRASGTVGGLKARKQGVKLIHVPEEIQTFLDGSDMSSLLETCTDLSQALASFK